MRSFPAGLGAVLCEAAIRPCRRWDGVLSVLGTLGSLLGDRAQGLSVRSVELLVLVHVSRAPIGAHHVAHVWVRSVRRDESLSLRGDRCENALLLEPLAVQTLARRVILKTRAANLS
jgi:hypothetical protein